MRKNKRKKKLKKSVMSEAQKTALIKGCQESPLTVIEYAKAHKVGPSSLYKWAATAGFSLKPNTADRKNQEDGDRLPVADDKTYGSEAEMNELPKLGLIYALKELFKSLKDILRRAIIRR